MLGLKRSKRVSWAPDVKLCQVRLFLSEDAPSQSGLGAQDLLQAKASWLWHSAGMGSDDSLPPGFEAPHAAYQFKREISQIPLIKWQCPPRIVFNPEWLVVAGEESEEVAVQNKRQLGVFEAFYPRPSSIPPNPSVSSEAQDSHQDDLHTPLIPLTAIEDEDRLEPSDMLLMTGKSVQLQQPYVPRSLSDMGTPHILPDLRFSVEQPQGNPTPDPSRAEKSPDGSVPGAEPDVVAAASAAFTAIMRSSEEGSLIDRDLLIKILSNPSLVERLVSEYGAPKQTSPPAAPISAPPPLPQINISAPLSAPPATQIYPIPNVITSPGVHRQTSPVPVIQTTTKPVAHAPPVKDVNYYKSLIQQHGEERQEALDLKVVQFPNHYDYRNLEAMNGVLATGHGSKQRDVKPKIPKPCVYFNSSRGCCHGANCSYQHDASVSQPIERRKGAKRIKLDRGIAGRN